MSNPNVTPGGKQHGLRPDGTLVEAVVAHEFERLYRGAAHDGPAVDTNEISNPSGSVSLVEAIGSNSRSDAEERVCIEDKAEYDKAMLRHAAVQEP